MRATLKSDANNVRYVVSEDSDIKPTSTTWGYLRWLLFFTVLGGAGALGYFGLSYVNEGTAEIAAEEAGELTILNMEPASLSCTEYEEEVDDCTGVSLDNIKDNGCGYYYELQTVDNVDYASACYCVVGTGSCARNDECAEVMELTNLNISPASLSCTDYEEQVEDCTLVSINNIKDNGCGYYYELQTINEVDYASACYCVVGTDSCSRNDECAEEMKLAHLDISPASLSCTDYEEEVDDCTGVSIDNIKDNGCGYYYELQTINEVNYASACYCVVGTDSCARNDECAEEMETTNLNISPASLSCTDYEEEVDDCTGVSIDNIKDNGCGYYYELQTINEVNYASACYCVVGTDSCARNDECAEEMELSNLKISPASLSCTDYEEEVDDCTGVSIDNIKDNGCGYYYELQTINEVNYASACYCVVGTDSCARNEECAEEMELINLNILPASLTCTDYEEEVDDCTEVSIDDIKSNGCGYYYEVQTIDGVNYASACFCVVGTDSCARNEECAEKMELSNLNISPASLSCTDYEKEVDDCTGVSIENIKSNGCGYYFELQTIDQVDYASACYCVVGTDSCARNDECAEEMELTDLNISPASLSCTEYEEEVDDCTEVSIDNIKSNGCGYYYELQTIDEVNYASACFCVVGTDSCERNEECAEELELINLNILPASLSCTDYEEEVDDCTGVSIEDIKDNGCGYYYEMQTINEVNYASACYCVVGTDSCARNDKCAEELELTNLNISPASLSCTDYEEQVYDCTGVSIDNIKENGCGYYYELQTMDEVDYASACYCVVGTDSCARNDDCAEEL